MLGPAVNRQPGFRRGLVEQSNAAKNNPAGWLAGSGWLAPTGSGWLMQAGLLAGWLLAGRLQAGWLADWLAGWVARSGLLGLTGSG